MDAQTVMPPEVRAEILRVGHMLAMGTPTVDPKEYADIPGGELGVHDLIVLSGSDKPDLALLNACLVVEHELREQEFAALEALLTLTQWTDGPLDDRLELLPVRLFAQAVQLLYQLNWVS
jgi:hypothetical protein